MDNVIAFDHNRRRASRPHKKEMRAPGVALVDLLPSWLLALEAERKSPYTLRSYRWSVETLAGWLEAGGHPIDTERIDADHMRAFLAAEAERTSDATSATHYRHLRVWWKWVAAEKERTAPNPMDNIGRPKVAKKAKTFLDDADLKALLDICSGASFEDRRDTAILRILMDTGLRVSGLADVRYAPDREDVNDVFLAKREMRVRLKGGDEWIVPLGRKAALALDRYLRLRNRHRLAAVSDWLWLSKNGVRCDHFTASGLRQMIKRRAEEAGLPRVTPHWFRRTFADDYLEGGGTVDGVMAIAGWKTYAMVKEYAGDRAAQRARRAHDRLSPGDRI